MEGDLRLCQPGADGIMKFMQVTHISWLRCVDRNERGINETKKLNLKNAGPGIL